MKIDASDKKVRNFGFLISIVMIAIATLGYHTGRNYWPWFVGGSAFFLLTGMLLKPVLRPIYALWMKFAYGLAWVNTRLLLGLFFYGIITPVGLVMRLLGKDPLTRKFKRSQTSYWVKDDPQSSDEKRYEHLF